MALLLNDAVFHIGLAINHFDGRLTQCITLYASSRLGNLL